MITTCSSLIRRLTRNVTSHFRYTLVSSSSFSSRNEKYEKKSHDERNQSCFDFSWLLGVTIGASLCGYLCHDKNLVHSESLILSDSDKALKHFSEPETPRQKFNFIAAVVEKAAPAVVCLEVKSNSRGFNYNINTSQTFSTGSGFIIEEDGLILTNAHVVLDQPNCLVQVKLHDGRVFEGNVEYIDKISDLATVRIKCMGLPILKLASSSDIKPGEWVVAVGSPLTLTNTVTTGVISSINRGSIELGLKGKHMEYLQTDASITFGNSGGPLINLDGEVVGVNVMKVTAGISFAIPIDYVKAFLSVVKSNPTEEETKELVDFKSQSPTFNSGVSRKQRRYMGVTLLTLTPQLITELQMRGTELPPTVKSGVLVWKVVLDSPAHWGGLQPGDVITSINGKPIESSQDIYRHLETKENQLQISIIRKREYMNFVIHLEDLPDQ